MPDDCKGPLAGVSRETSQRLERYAELIQKWTGRINLVAPGTLADIWTRHFADSAQLLHHRPPGACRWVDLGSGGGFPGLVVAILAGIAALTLAPRQAAALTQGTAEALVRDMVDDVKRAINSGQSQSAILSQFEQLFERYADVPTIARFALGAPARSASQADLRAYTDAFSTYVSRKYGRRFQEFIGGEVTINRSREDRNGIVVVETTANLRGEDPFAVDFHVSDRSGSPKLFNVIIEGVNMLTTERTEIGALYDQAGARVWLRVPAGTDLRAGLGRFDGRATLIRAAPETRAALGAFHPRPAAVARLEAGLRAQFDPRGILNPGLMR